MKKFCDPFHVSVPRQAASSAFSSSSSATVARRKEEFSAECRRKILVAMPNLWLSCFLLVAILGLLEVVSGGGEVWSSMRFPNEELGPDNWRYYRVELPPVFSLLTISLARDWAQDGNGSAATGPLVCFGFNGPPLPAEPGKSLPEAAVNAGASQNASATGECGWFNDSVEVNVTNLEVRSGMLHVGIFSNPMPTRTQSKMIPRGKKYGFGMDIQVFWCGTGALGGPECNLGIGSLLPRAFLKSLHSMNTPLRDDRSFLSSRSSKNQLDKELVAQSCDELSPKYSTQPESKSSSILPERSTQPQGHKDEDPADLGIKKQDDVGTTAAKSGWSDWISSSEKCIGLDENQFFSLQIVDFVQELEIKYDCISNASHGISKCEEFESMVKEGRIPVLHLRHGALPGRDTSDFLGEPSTGSIIITEPKRGWWFVAIFNPTVTSKREEGKNTLTAGDDMCLELKWRARTCGPSLTGDDCRWPVLLLERIVEKEFESPFDSYYHPASKSEFVDDASEWFSLDSFLNESASEVAGEQWGFAIFRVADGAAGAFLSIDVKTSLTVNTELYARHEGCPSSSIWDLKAVKEDSQRLSELGGGSQGVGLDLDGSQKLVASKYQTLTLPVVYPMEGYWCVGLKYRPRETNMHATVMEDSSSKENRTTGERSRGDGFNVRDGNLSSGNGKEMDLRVLLHGCPNKCSGHGSCQTVYEASRLHFISYCRCDVVHGGFDCSTVVLGLWNDLRQRFLLIFSNAAAILPSAWALRHKAYSEWITFTLSGIASAIYHSCDAGGWCVMSFSTLQFLDFWLSFVVIIMTCLLMAGFYGPTKAMLHIGCAILTAAVAKEDATSGWSVLVVVLISSTGLLLGWGLETQKLSALRLRWSASIGISRATWRQLVQRLVRSFVIQLRDRFNWRYLTVGLALLLSAVVSNLMEQPETYWIFHSWWHICIYTSAFVLLYSIRTVDGAMSRRVDDLEGYQHISIAQRQDEDNLTDSHEALVSELDSFPESHVR